MRKPTCTKYPDRTRGSGRHAADRRGEALNTPIVCADPGQEVEEVSARRPCRVFPGCAAAWQVGVDGRWLWATGGRGEGKKGFANGLGAEERRGEERRRQVSQRARESDDLLGFAFPSAPCFPMCVCQGHDQELRVARMRVYKKLNR
jgi:hypothetical protein